ncbi:MAG: DMT family transporter [Gemmobacter sp.]|uniref:DMT family transporter n=1 Tax=Gemmobacter sp. TaxID=1898957 RepID=UPI001A5DFE63|nr:DMT family transporter [Gemmobacter sp.]MBL8563485.1 DMT family transporter [Gemmobacter sp.]
MRPLTANLLCLASMLVWAMGLPAADLLIGPVPPLWLVAARMAVAAAVLLPVWLIWERPDWRRAPWGKGAAVGALLGACGFLIVVAQAATDAVTVAVVSASMPVIGITIEVLAEGRRVSLPLLAGVALSLAGGLLVYAAAMGNLDLGLGALAALVSTVLFTLASRWTVTALPAQSPLGRTALTIAGAALVTGVAALVASALGSPSPDWAAIGPREWGALLIYGFFAMGLSQMLWIASLGHLGIGLGALHINAAPFYVMIFLFLLGQPWNWMQALGALIVGLGVLIAQSGPVEGRKA